MRTPLVRTVAALGVVLALALASCGTARQADDHPRSRGATPPTSSSARRTSTTVGPTTSTSTPANPSEATPGANQTWPSYHDNDARTAAVSGGPSLDPARKAWTVNLGGVVQGQPVVADGRIFAATEKNRVVALDPRTSRILWSRSLGRPLTNVDAVAGCGDIDPLGITSTPVVDLASGVIYVVAEVSTGDGRVHHELEGLSVKTGATVLSDDVDPPLPGGERAVNLLQRASLALGNGRVYIGYGGNDGDCGVYHGWVVAVDATGAPHELAFEVASTSQGGAVWESGGAPALDTQGNVYVSTGNMNPFPGSGPDPGRFTESVVKLTAELKPIASYKDPVAGGDDDLGTGNPVLLPDGDIFSVGKTDIGYVLRQSNLSRVAAIGGVCGSDPDGGPAFDAATDRIFVPCRGGGIQEINLADHKLGPRLSGANGAPILVGSHLWALDYPGGVLDEYNANTGAQLQTLQVGSAVPTFATPSAALGLILVPTVHGVTAFEGPHGVLVASHSGDS